MKIKCMSVIITAIQILLIFVNVCCISGKLLTLKKTAFVCQQLLFSENFEFIFCLTFKNADKV